MSLPELFGSYLLHHRLARGTTSEVFLAQTTGAYPRLCAVKRIHAEAAAQPEFDDRFQSDAALLVRLIHGNLVQTLEVGAVEERRFLAMELIDGVDLSELISLVPQQGPLPPELCMYVGLELCEALGYLQTRRRDQVAASEGPWALELMIGFDGLVKLVDLGSFGAVALGQQSVERIVRTPGYAVPEVVRKQPLTAASDLFAVGLILWELLEGRRLAAADPERYIRELLAGTWEAPLCPRKDVPGDIIRLVLQLLQLDPDRRPRSLEEVRRRLVECLRRLAPSFGSAAVAQIVARRCPELVGRSEELQAQVLLRARTEPRAEAAPGRTLTYGHARDAALLAAEAKPLKPGDAIPGTRYRLVRWLGRGSSASVCAAQHVDLERQVALKILSPALTGNAEAIAQFRMEARACGRVGHPNIVEVVDFGELSDGRFFFAMELLDGASLVDVESEQGPLEPGRTIGIFRQIARAVQAAHEHGIVHRDLKPENIMLIRRDERDDFVKVLDFGVMAFAGQAGTWAGTPGYMAPEQTAGVRPTAAMDIYALGAMLYEALSAELPYPAPDLHTFLEEQARLPPPALRSRPRATKVPAALERVVHRALERDPAARHPSMADLEQDLMRAQREAGLRTGYDDLSAPHAVHDRRQAEASPTRLRWPWAVAAGMAGIGLLGALIAGLALTRHMPDRKAASANNATSKAVTSSPESGAATQRAGGAASGPLRDLLRRADEAVSDGLFSQPPGRSALDFLRRAEREFPRDPRVHDSRQRIARLLEGAGDRLAAAGLPRSARTLYNEARLFDPSSTRLAEVLRASGAGDPARRGLTDASNSDGVHEPGLARLAWLLSQVQLSVAEGRYLSPPGRNALAYLVQLKQLDPTGHRTAEARGVMTANLRREADAQWGRGQFERAVPIYRLVLALDPDDQVARARQYAPAEAATPAKVSKVSKVAKAATKATVGQSAEPADPARAAALVAEGRRLLREGQLGGARERFRAALKAHTRSAPALAGLAAVAFEEAGYTSAVQLSRQALAIDPRLVQAHLLLGNAAFHLHRHDDARRAWEQVLRLEPGNRHAKSSLQKLDGEQP